MSPDPRTLAQLLRLRSLRLQSAARVLRERQAERAAAQQAVADRQRRIEAHQRQIRDAALAAVSNCAAQPGRWAHWVSAYRDKLDDLLERDEYGLIDDQEHLAEIDQRCTEARRQWMREQAREEVARDLLHRSRVHRLQAGEAAAELELEDRRRPDGEGVRT